MSTCHSLEKLSLASWSNTEIKSMASLIVQNSETLKVLDMSYVMDINPIDMKHIMSNCMNLIEISFSNSRLSSESTEALIRYLPSNVLKLNLAGLRITDKSILEIMQWCKKIVELDLSGTRITLTGVISIVNNLSKTLENLWLPTQINFSIGESPNLLSILF